MPVSRGGQMPNNSPIDREVADALAGLAPDDPLILDFDETLWLRNSTEAFLDSLRPKLLAVLILKTVNVTRLWRLLPGPNKEYVYRDWTRVLLCVALMPWSILFWRHRARRLGPEYANRQLIESIPARHRGPVFVASVGFRIVVEPLLRGMGLPRMTLYASPLLMGFRWRRVGKRRVLERRLGRETLAPATVITDNDDDQDLCDACRRSVHHRWREARYHPALADAYVPFYYTEKIKRPGQRHLISVILGEDLFIIFLVYGLFSESILFSIILLFLLYISFWSIYEIGYYENDCLAAYEENPIIPEKFREKPYVFDQTGAWVFAILSAFCGYIIYIFYLMQLSDVEMQFIEQFIQLFTNNILVFICWVVFLCFVRGLFFLYNHFDEKSRSLLFLLLQIVKYIGFLIWLPINFMGALICLAQVISRYIPYIVYRYGQTRWQTPDKLYRTIIFLVLAGFVLPGVEGVEHPVMVQFGLFLLWCVWKARHEGRDLATSFRWLRARHSDASRDNRPR